MLTTCSVKQGYHFMLIEHQHWSLIKTKQNKTKYRVNAGKIAKS